MLLEIEGLYKKYGSKEVIKNLNFIINSPGIIGIVGESGCGKSILIKIIIGSLLPTSGKINIYSKLGFSMQNNAIYQSLTVRENLDYFATIYEVRNKGAVIDNILQELSLKQYENITINNLSGGTQKRVDIACALINDPETIVLDEPFTGLDSKLTKELTSLLINLHNKGKTIIITSHILETIDGLCTKFFLMENGALLEIKKGDLRNKVI
ncbi:ABC transporter ATP-binding protein [Candidatus Pacearchaeota archaeon]|nr:ABC transporter ATP-binding protein [Candidatus Pacearchaeota archaeon]